jgi:hypothetical protein
MGDSSDEEGGEDEEDLMELLTRGQSKEESVKLIEEVIGGTDYKIRMKERDKILN